MLLQCCSKTLSLLQLITLQPYGTTVKPHDMIKQITAERADETTDETKPIRAERAIEAIQICSVSRNDSAIAYQSIQYPGSVRITGVAIVSSYDIERLASAGFYCWITRSYNIQDWGVEIRIYDQKQLTNNKTL